MTKSMFNPGEWAGALGKLTGDIKDDNPVDQTDLRIICGLSYIGGMATQGYRANKRFADSELTGEPVKPFKMLLA